MKSILTSELGSFVASLPLPHCNIMVMILFVSHLASWFCITDVDIA